MEAVLTILLCAIGVLLYLLNENNNKIMQLNRERREKQIGNEALPPMPYSNSYLSKKNETVREVVVLQPVYIPQTARNNPPSIPALPANGIFVSVIFKRNARKRYDYFLGNNYDVQVGDFVLVPVHDKFDGENKIKVAQVVYVSSYGEFSHYANSSVVRKYDYAKW